MLDLRFIREHPDIVRNAIETKRSPADLDKLLSLDSERRTLIQEADDLKAKRNRVSEEIGNLKKAGKDGSAAITEMKTVSTRIKELDGCIRSAETDMNAILVHIPNIPHPSVPVGPDASANEEVKSWGEIPSFDFKPKPHWDLGPALGLLDFERGSRLSGSNFVTFTGMGARLERALINFMIDLHTERHGYTEVSVPFVVRREMMFGTGQLPKLEDDAYLVERGDLFLIPTAEVPVTNLHREEMLRGEDLPIKYVAYTPCFRREAGSYGADTRGLMRIHQFDKVEMVRLVNPDTSYDELESLLSDAEEILQRLELPYRILSLATGDLSFAAAKCYDIEVYASGIDRWLEVSSCSNFEDFQARRMEIRFRRQPGAKPEYIHTLNGSGVAMPRTLIAILENYQTDEGTVVIPEALRPYVGVSVIKPSYD